MTDAIITWVEGTDPEFRRKRSHYLQLEKGEKVPHEPDAALDTRINECGELYYNIRLIRKNAPWIERIYLITDNQRPQWLTEAAADELGVEVVDHHVIFSGFEDCLPTFNSRSIETVMHRIPGLAPEFLYLNDDFFILRPVVKEEYFQNGYPVFRAHRQVRDFPWPFMKRRPWRWEEKPDDGLVGLGLGQGKIFRGKKERVVLYHAPYPVNTQRFATIMARRMPHNAQFRFRSPEQFRAISLYANLMLQQKKCGITGSDVAYFHPEIMPQLTPQSIRELAGQDRIRHACFQSLDVYDDTSRQAVFDFLEDRIAA